MKKKVVIAGIIALVLLFPVLRNAYIKAVAPEKVLIAGSQISAGAYQFTKEVTDESKIADFERLFDEIDFVEEDWNETSYADLMVQINHKRGIWTHPLKIWFVGDEGIAQMYTIEKTRIGRLSRTQVEALQEILN